MCMDKKIYEKIDSIFIDRFFNGGEKGTVTTKTILETIGLNTESERNRNLVRGRAKRLRDINIERVNGNKKIQNSPMELQYGLRIKFLNDRALFYDDPHPIFVSKRIGWVNGTADDINQSYETNRKGNITRMFNHCDKNQHPFVEPEKISTIEGACKAVMDKDNIEIRKKISEESDRYENRNR